MPAAAPVVFVATWWPAASGPYAWREFPTASALTSEFGRIRAAGITAIRVPLAWDAFMPTDRAVSRPRLAELERLLRAATDTSLQVVPVLFAQSFGDCVILPSYAVDRRRPRPGVRVVSEGVVRPGGPRDLYTDPLMLELCEVWLRTLLGAFANHPAVAAWDLGHDPVTTVRPRRTVELVDWVRLMAAMVRAQGDRCWLTMGAGDVFAARGVRLGALAAEVDLLGLACGAEQQLLAPEHPGAAAPSLFLAQLGQRLAGDGRPVMPHARLSVVADGVDDASDPAAAKGLTGATMIDRAAAVALCERLLDGWIDGGSAGIATWWSDTATRTAEAPPFDRFPELRRLGVAGADGVLKAHGERWATTARAELSVRAAQPWPPRLDVEDWYAGLPHSAHDLYAAWRADCAGEPAILD